jgi:tape measure domain-containing protein
VLFYYSKRKVGEDMATIRTAIQIQDSMTPVMRSMNNALNICINSFEAMQNASGHAVDTASISAARAELARVETAMNEVEQNIRDADNAQRQLNSDMRSASSAAEGFAGKIKTVVGAMATMAGLKKAMDLSDMVAQTTARLDLMNDGMQTTAQLQEMIFQSAQRARGAYQTTADSVSKLGMQAAGAFKSNSELIAFTEQLNKTFVIAGASAVGVDSVMLQLTQSMAAGKLQGEELNAVLDNAQPVVANIQNYLQNVRGMPKSVTDNIKQLASDGVITAEIVKNAMFYAADETNKKFATMPKTFGQVWTSMQNQTLMAFQPVLQKLNTVANSDNFERIVDGSIAGMVTLSNVAINTFDIMSDGVVFVADNWSFIEPIIWGVAAAYGVYNANVLIGAVRTAYDTVVKYAHAAASWAETAAIIALEAAQFGLNAAIAMCPISWIIMAIIGLIAIFYLAVAAVNKFAGTSLSATGIIMGAFSVLGFFIMNIIIYLINGWINFAEFFINVWDNPLYAAKQLFANFGNDVINIIGTIASAIDKVFGSNLSSAVTSLKSQLSGWAGEMPSNYKVLGKLQMTNLDDAYNSGYNIGNDVANKFDLSNLGNMNPGQGLGLDLSKLGNDMADTAANTGKMKDSLDITEEDLKYLRDIAEQEVINRFTTAEINVNMNNQNTVSSDMDLDGMVTYLKDTLVETVQTAAEKVHK